MCEYKHLREKVRGEDMYSLLIADDEALIRNGIKKIIDWESLGFSEIFLAEDGQEALEIIRKNKVDLVLTDIVMPFMDGLELSKVLSEEFPEIHVVILTGHEDFEYAQKSVDLGVKNYILKPVGAETLYKKMSEICKKLHIANEQKQYISAMRRQLHQSIPALRSQTLNRIVCLPNANLERYIESGKSLSIDLSKGPYTVGIVEVDLSEILPEDCDLYLFACENIAHECIGDEHYIFEDSNGKITILLRCCLLDEGFHEVAYQIMCVIQKAIYNTIKIRTTCAVGSVVQTPSELHESYVSAQKALDCKYSLGSNNVYDIGDLDYLEKAFYYPVNETKNLVNSIKFKGSEDIKAAVQDIIASMSNGRKLSGINMKMIYVEVITSLLRELSDLKQVSEQIWADGFDFYKAIDQMGVPEKMEEKLLEFCSRIHKEMNSVRNNSSIQIIEKVKEFVNLNYKDPDLSLSKAADFVAVSTGYLSGLFKKETGTNFVKYLTDVRMEKSMELLKKTDMKTYEIAFETGFANSHYFSVSFKKYTGMSPSDFRMKE